MKSAVELIPQLALMEVGRVLGHSREAGKYPPQGWLTNPQRRITKDAGAGFRHLLKFLAGFDYDHDTGLLHAAHAATRLLIVTEMQIRGLGVDDRDKTTQEKNETTQLWLRANLMQP